VPKKQFLKRKKQITQAPPAGAKKKYIYYADKFNNDTQQPNLEDQHEESKSVSMPPAAKR